MNLQEIYKTIYKQRFKRIMLYSIDNEGKLIQTQCTLDDIKIENYTSQYNKVIKYKQILLVIKKFRKIKTESLIKYVDIPEQDNKEFIIIPGWEDYLKTLISKTYNNKDTIDSNKFTEILEIAININQKIPEEDIKKRTTYLVSEKRLKLISQK